MSVTPAQAKLLAAMRAVIDSGAWALNRGPYGQSVRWESPECAMPAHSPKIGGWSGPYRRYVFVTIATGAPMLKVSAAPWMAVSTTTVTFKRAHAVLADPASVF